MSITVRALMHSEMVAIVVMHLIDSIEGTDTVQEVARMLWGDCAIPADWTETELISYIDTHKLPVGYCNLSYAKRLTYCP